MAKKYKKDTLSLEGATNVEQAAVKPPDYIHPNYYNSPYKIRDINEAPQYDPYARYRKLGLEQPQDVISLAEMESEVPFYSRDIEGQSTSARGDRMRILPKVGSLLHDVFVNMGSKSQTVLDFLANPPETVSQEEEDAFIQSGEYTEYTKHLNGYTTRWETLNNQGYPKEALDKLASPEFRAWWYADPIGKKVPKGPSSVIDPSMPKGIALPEIITHGTFHVISREDGFMQLNANDFAPKYDEHGNEMEWELGPHMGTPGQALDIVFEKEGYDSGVLPHRQHLTDYVKSNPQAFMKGGEPAKFYPGFLKMNNPLVIPYELGNWNFDAIMNFLQQPMLTEEPTMIITKDEFGDDVFSAASPSYLDKHGYTYSRNYMDGHDNVDVPLKVGYGTAITKILEYAADIAEEDGIQIQFDLDELERHWNEDMTDEERDIFMMEQMQQDVTEEMDIPIGTPLKRDILYYRNLGLMKFIQDDLGYDGIKYFNQVEDKAASDWSYIMFSPNQFKSIYNEGTFKWTDEKGKPWKDFMSKTNVPRKEQKKSSKYMKKGVAA